MKQSMIRYLLPLVLFTSICSSLSAQKFDSLLNILDSRYPQEKIYVHFDRSYYNPGETIWMKAYLFVANVPSQISKTIYAELIDDKGKVIERRTAPVLMSGAAAAFDLAPNITSPVVYVRVYTDWMMNFDSSLLFSKAIPVIQPKSTAAKTISSRTILQLFPESGDLVEGVESRVAFKATDIKGLPVALKGSITDSKGKTITAFDTEHDGMGYFLLTPQPKEQYKATWKDAAGKAQQTVLPAARKDGIVLKLEQEASGIRFAISRPDGDVKANEFVYLVGQMQQQMVYMATANISKNKTVTGTIPTENIPAGIVQMTVFSDDQKPLAERIVFVNKQDYYFITDLNAPLKSFEKRKKNVIQIDVPDTIRTNLSVSITDAGANPYEPGEEDIFSSVLLTSDLRGYVHHPGYYFSSDADSVIRHLDLVMMTNGWRRFKWEDLLAGKFPRIKYEPAEYLTISGKINGLIRTDLVNRELSGILEMDKKQQFVSIPIDPATSTFSIPGAVFYDTAKLYYQFNNDKDRVLTTRANFVIKNNLLMNYGPFKPDTNAVARFNLPDQDILAKSSGLAAKTLELSEQRRKVQMLESVTVTAKQKTKQQQMEEQYTSGLFAGGDGYTFLVEDDLSAKGAFSVLNYLQGRVAGLQITGNGSQMSMSWRGGSPSLFLNEMLSDVSSIQSISMSDVAMVKVYRPPFMGAPGGGSGGAIAVYTKRGAALNNNVKTLDFVKIPGYSPVREFYSPDYSRYDEKHIDADFRPTLYWNPFVLTDKNTRRIVFSFYNNDVTRKFRVVVEGCNTDGRLTRMEKVFE